MDGLGGEPREDVNEEAAFLELLFRRQEAAALPLMCCSADESINQHPTSRFSGTLHVFDGTQSALKQNGHRQKENKESGSNISF